MSLKSTAFSLTFPAPKTLDKFYIMVPGNSQSLLRVSAASLPFTSRGEGVIYYLGRPLFIPNSKEVDGDWTCIYEEDLALTGIMTISSVERRIQSYFFKPGDIQIFLTDQVTGVIPQQSVLLRYAWLKKVEPLQLDWSKPDQSARWRLTFRYSAINRWY